MKRLFRRRPTVQREISPDEIFIEVSNISALDADRLEGRLEQPIGQRTLQLVSLALALIGLLFFGQIFYLSVVQGAHYAERAHQNRLESSIVFAQRGVIYDRYGVELAWNTAGRGDEPRVSTRRAYTDLPGLGHVLGYSASPQADRSGVFFRTTTEGVAGVEQSFDAELTGVNGRRVFETDARNARTAESVLVEPVHGTAVTLSLDAEFTSALYGQLKELADRIPFRAGTAMVMDTTSGEVIALTNYPEISPNTLAAGDEEAIRTYQNDPRTPFLNRAIAGVFAPGSVVKPVVALGALEEGLVHPRTTFVSTGALLVANPYLPGSYTRFADWKAHGLVDMRRALAVSSDVYFYYVGGGFGDQPGLGITRLAEYYERFGYGTTSGIALAGEKAGTVPTPAWKQVQFPEDPVWRLGNTYHTAIGQYGFLATPLQVLRTSVAFANGRALPVPRLSSDEPYRERAVEMDPAHLLVIREGMRQAVTEGTARALDVPYVAVAAKTGTAELGAHKRYVNSWVTGYFPYDEPRYAFVILMEYGPSTNLTGASSVGRNMLEWLREHRPQYLNLPDATP